MIQTKLDGRSLYELLKIADQVLERTTGPAFDRLDPNDTRPIPIAIHLTTKQVLDLKYVVTNTRQVLEHVVFEVEPPHAIVHNSVAYRTENP